MFQRKKDTVPEWAGFFGEKEYKQFMAAVEEYFIDRGEAYAIGDGFVKLGDGYEVGLVNLAQTCARSKPQDYPLIIKGHITSLTEAKAFRDQFDKIKDDFNEVKQYIGTRIYDEGYISVVGKDNSILRPFAGELYEVLVYDFPHSVSTLSKSETEKWGKTEDELFAIGIENIRRNYDLETVKVSFGDDEVFTVETEHFFAANILFELKERPELVGKGGAIVAAPTRSFAMIYPICDMKVVKALTMFFNTVPGFYADGPGSLTSEIYWYKDGQYEKLNLAYEPDKNVRFTPSEKFLALLNGGLE